MTAEHEVRAGTILDSWVSSIYLEAVRVEKMVERSGVAVSEEGQMVLDYLLHDFLRDTMGQIALFQSWKADGCTSPMWVEPEPGDLPGHNWRELKVNYGIFFRQLQTMHRLVPQAEGVAV